MNKKNIPRITRQVINILAGGLFGRPITGPLRVSWAVTYRCNSGCRMCSRQGLQDNPGNRPELNSSQAREFIKQCARAGVVNLSYTGGEPFLRPDLLELTGFAKARGITVITATTNGILLHNFIDGVVRAGISLLSVSLDAADKESYKEIRGIDAFDCVINNIKSLVMARKASGSALKIAVNTVINAKNYNQLPKIAAMAKKLGADSFNFGPANHIPEDGFVMPPDMEFTGDSQEGELKRIIADLLSDDSLKLRADKKFYSGIPDFIFKKEKTRSVPCWATHLSVFVTPYGDIYPCNGRMVLLGNVGDKGLSAAWSSKVLLNLRKKVKSGDHPLCWMSCYAPFRNKLMPLLLSNMRYADLL